MIPCRFCKAGWLTLARTEVKHARGTTELCVVQCTECGERANNRDAADYYRELSTKGRNLFEKEERR